MMSVNLEQGYLKVGYAFTRFCNNIGRYYSPKKASDHCMRVFLLI